MARATKRATAGISASSSTTKSEPNSSSGPVGSGSTVQSRSPATASGSWLVATIEMVGASRRIRATSSATGSIRCSQLSSTSKLCRGRSRSTMASSIELDFRRFTSMAVASAAAVASLSTTPTNSTTWTPSSNWPPTVRASSIPSEVFPTPPGPTSVTSRWSMIMSASCSSNISRPISGCRRKPIDALWPLVPASMAPRPDPPRLPPRCHEFVALAVHSPNDRLLAAVVADGLADRLDPGRQRRLTHEAITPDCVEQFLLAHHRAAVLDEVGEHVEHLGFDPDLLAAPPEDDAVQVQLAVGESDHITRP